MQRAFVTGPNQRWAMDFMYDVLPSGTKVRVVTLDDVWRRECLTRGRGALGLLANGVTHPCAPKLVRPQFDRALVRI